MNSVIPATDMKPLIPYVVVTASSDGSIEIGEYLWLGRNGKLNILDKTGGGWLEPEEWQSPETCDFAVRKTDRMAVTVVRGREIARAISTRE